MGCGSSKKDGDVKENVPAQERKRETSASEDQLMATLRSKRRYKNVFAETVEDQVPEVTAAMAKDDDMVLFLTKALAENFVCASLDDTEVGKIVEYLARERIAKNTEIIKQGENGDYFYVVESGTFDFIKDGEKKGSCGEGGSFGELALLYGAPRAATVIATSDAYVWAVDRKTFRTIVASGSAKSKKRVYDALTRVDLLSGLTDDQLALVADAVQIIKFSQGTRIINKNETGNVFYMIESGQVDCTDVGNANQFQDLVLAEGEYFGERALLTDQLRAANVTAKTDVTLLALDREAFQRVLGPLRALLDRNLSTRVLRSLELLKNLTEEEHKKAITLFRERHFEPGIPIVKQGDAGDEFFIIKTGKATVLIGESTVKNLEAGDYFGEMALLSKEPRKATVEAHAQDGCDCFVLSRQDFDQNFGQLKHVMNRESKKRSEEIKSLEANEDMQHVSIKDFQIKTNLGSGTFGRVKLVTYIPNPKQTYALKIMHKAEIVKHAQVKNVVQEKKLMSICVHPFILRLFTTFQDNHKLYLLLEFVQGGELFSVLHTNHSDGVSEMHAKFYAAGICAALELIHAKNVAYRDLKPENILIAGDGYPKVVDFGFAKIVTRKTYTLCGTPEYLAPEIVLGKGHDTNVDWWAFGILIFEMIAGYSPFSDSSGAMDQIKICKNIVNGKLIFPKKFGSKDSQDICKKLLTRSVTDRLGVNPQDYPVSAHDWFAKINFSAYLQKKPIAPWIPKIKNQLDTSNFDDYQQDDSIDHHYKDTPTLWTEFSA
mmetsp:Transcript_20020/g.30469  ORF Transcript_20020/g.30469 Transcript_20020/m.30469 type:complete len:773 (-) Transcript_20020:766-3084(-)